MKQNPRYVCYTETQEEMFTGNIYKSGFACGRWVIAYSAQSQCVPAEGAADFS